MGETDILSRDKRYCLECKLHGDVNVVGCKYKMLQQFADVALLWTL